MRIKNKDRSVARRDIEPGFHKVEGVPLLYLRVRELEGGDLSRHFYLIYRKRKRPGDPDGPGRQVRVALGRYPDEMSLADAGERAVDARRAIRDGLDPAAARRANLEAITFGELARRYLEEHASQKRRPGRDRWALEKYALPRWRDTAARDIARVDVRELLKTVNGDFNHNRVKALLSKVFNFAIEHDLLDGANPVTGIKNKREPRRERALEDDEIRAVWATGNPVLRLVLATVQRPEDVKHMRWGDISGATWTIPESRFKTGRTHVVPLSSLALEILEAIPRRGARDAVFSQREGRGAWARRRGNTGLALWQAYLDSVGVPDARPKDLQRTARTRLTGLGVSPDVAERVQGHVIPGVRGVYDTWDFEPQKREALERWAEELRRIINKETAKVARIRG